MGGEADLGELGGRGERELVLAGQHPLASRVWGSVFGF